MLFLAFQEYPSAARPEKLTWEGLYGILRADWLLLPVGNLGGSETLKLYTDRFPNIISKNSDYLNYNLADARGDMGSHKIK